MCPCLLSSRSAPLPSLCSQLAWYLIELPIFLEGSCSGCDLKVVVPQQRLAAGTYRQERRGPGTPSGGSCSWTCCSHATASSEQNCLCFPMARLKGKDDDKTVTSKMCLRHSLSENISLSLVFSFVRRWHADLRTLFLAVPRVTVCNVHKFVQMYSIIQPSMSWAPIQ